MILVSTSIYDGSFRNRRIPGMDVAAALLAQQGVKIYSEEDLTEELLQELLNNELKCLRNKKDRKSEFFLYDPKS